MANEKISEYLLEFAGSFDNVDIRLDISHNTDGIGAWVTKYTRGSTLINQLATDIATIYSKDSALSGARIVDQATFNLSFINGLVAIGNSAPGIAKLRILSGVGENPLQIDTNSSSNTLVVIDDGVTGKVAFGHNSPTEGVHSTVAVRIDAKILQNLSTAQSFSDVHFAKESANALISQVTNASSNAVIAAIRTRGTIAAPSALLNGDIVGQYVYTGHNGSSLTDVAQITAISRENYSVGNHGTELQFLTTSLTAGAPSLKMVITADGNVGIGTAAPASGIKIHVVGASLFQGDTTIDGTSLVKIGTGGVNTKGHFRVEHISYSGQASRILIGYRANSDDERWRLDSYLTGTRLHLNSDAASRKIEFTSVQNATSIHTNPITFGNSTALTGTIAVGGSGGGSIIGYQNTNEVYRLETGVSGDESVRGIFSLLYNTTQTRVHFTALNTAGGDVATSFKNRSYLANGLSLGYTNTTITNSVPDILLDVNGESNFGDTITMENSTSTYLDFDHSANDVFTHVTKYVSSDGFETRLAHNSTDRIKWSANSDNFNTQPVNFGTAAAVNSVAQVEITSTTKGFMPPVMTAVQASAITAVNGLMLYATSTDATFTSVGIWAYEGGAWAKL